MIINAVGGSFGIKDYPYSLENWQKSLNLNILKHILINNFFLKKMINNKFGRILFFLLQQLKIPRHQLLTQHQKHSWKIM